MLLTLRFPRDGLGIYELGDAGLTQRQRQEYPTRELNKVDYGESGISEPYHNEELVEVGGTRLPFIVYAGFNDLFSLELKVLDEPFRRRFPLTAVDDRLEQAVIKPIHTNGQVISLCGWRKLETSGLELLARQARYFDLLVSNVSQDVDLSQLDRRFKKGQTFRKMEVQNGQKTPFKDSFLANSLGAACLVRTADGFYILGRRRKNLALDAGAWSVIGTTPPWRDYFEDETRQNERGNVALGYSFFEYTLNELKDELALNPTEVKFRNGWLVDELYRGPALFTVWDTSAYVDDIVERCRRDENVKCREEHDYLMSLDASRTEIPALFLKGMSLKDGEYILHRPSEMVSTYARGVSLDRRVFLDGTSLSLMELAQDDSRISYN